MFSERRENGVNCIDYAILLLRRIGTSGRIPEYLLEPQQFGRQLPTFLQNTIAETPPTPPRPMETDGVNGDPEPPRPQTRQERNNAYQQAARHNGRDEREYQAAGGDVNPNKEERNLPGFTYFAARV